MTVIRNPVYDIPKTMAQLKKDFGATCIVCGEPVSHFQGPGMSVLCRDHQLKQREYGGPGRIDRPHTFHRKWVCDHCGRDVSVDVSTKYPNLEVSDPKLFNRLCRNRIIADHIIRKSDGGDDSSENIQSLCLDCNSDKTILNEDFRNAKLSTKLPLTLD